MYLLIKHCGVIIWNRESQDHITFFSDLEKAKKRFQECLDSSRYHNGDRIEELKLIQITEDNEFDVLDTLTEEYGEVIASWKND